MAENQTGRLEIPAPVGRLAPSPTGALHLGNARTFLLGWLSIRQQSGTIVLRMEDLDLARAKPGAAQRVIDDLKWMGLDWDFGPDTGTGRIEGIPLHQSNRLDRYREVLRQLILDDTVYPCECTRSKIAQQIASAPHESGWNLLEGPIYPGTCRQSRHETDSVFEFTSEMKPALRWQFAAGEMQWLDQFLGPQTANPMLQLGDFVIGYGNGHPSYQLAVVVDDYEMGITEVVRGDDLVLSTYRQQAIIRHLGWPSPKYYHVPLVFGPDGQRLAKRQGDSLTYLRCQSISAEAIVGYLAYSTGMISRPEKLRPSDLIGLLDWSKVNRESFQLPQNWLDEIQ